MISWTKVTSFSNTAHSFFTDTIWREEWEQDSFFHFMFFSLLLAPGCVKSAAESITLMKHFSQKGPQKDTGLCTQRNGHCGVEFTRDPGDKELNKLNRYLCCNFSEVFTTAKQSETNKSWSHNPWDISKSDKLHLKMIYHSTGKI